jgi:hypothetical protein
LNFSMRPRKCSVTSMHETSRAPISSRILPGHPRQSQHGSSLKRAMYRSPVRCQRC